MIRLSLALLAVVFLAGCAGSAGTAGSSAPQADNSSSASAPAAAAAPAPAATTSAPRGKVHKLASGLVYEDVIVGNGKMADPGLEVSVDYRGTLADGTPVDNSYDRGRPYTFTLGAGRVVAGWDEGIKGMRVGGKRKLTIPPDMGYGAEGRPPVVPPNSVLLFEVVLVSVR
jgi:peptidylprolyl isomerase